MIMASVGWLFWVLASAGVIYTAMTAIFFRRFFALPTPLKKGAAPWSSITLLKPLHGVEPMLRENLESFCRQDVSIPMTVVFGLQDPADPALAVVETLKDRIDGSEMRICLSDATHGQNRKISNLINMSIAGVGDLIVLSDSDIGAPPDYLQRLLAALDGIGVGVVTCPYYGEAQTGFWARIAAMGVSYQFLPNVITGVSLGMAKPCMGSTIALTRENLDRIGGFHAFKDVLADDYAIGAAVRGLGLKSVVAPLLVSHMCSEKSAAEVLAHELRWAKTVKGVDFAGHVGSAVTHPLPLALIAAVFMGFSPLSLIVLGAAYAVRVWLMGVTDGVIGRRLGPWWLIPVRDMLSFIVFVGSFFVRSVEWRGVKFHVSADGDLKPV